MYTVRQIEHALLESELNKAAQQGNHPEHIIDGRLYYTVVFRNRLQEALGSLGASEKANVCLKTPLNVLAEQDPPIIPPGIEPTPRKRGRPRKNP